MYICIYVYMYICIYVYMYVCHICMYIYHRYHRSSRYHPCHPWQRKIISQTFQLDLINQHPTLDVENGRSSNHKQHFYKYGNSPKKFSKISPGRLSKNIQTIGFTPQRPGVLNKTTPRYSSFRLANLHYPTPGSPDKSAPLQRVNLPPTICWEITRAIPKEVVLRRGWNGCFQKIVGFPLKSSILTGFSMIKNHPFWGTTIFGNTQIMIKNQLEDGREGMNGRYMIPRNLQQDPLNGPPNLSIK